LARIPNPSVISAAPASHPPAMPQYRQQSLENSQSNIIDLANAKGTSTAGPNANSGISVAQRSFSRARQFGKDLTNMFSFTRNN